MANNASNISVSNRIFAPIVGYLEGSTGVPASTVNTFILNVVTLINESVTLKAEINAMNALFSEGINWTINFLPPISGSTPGAAQTDPANRQVQINLDPKTIDQSASANEFVASLAYELGHVEDPQANAISYSGNALAAGAQTALDMLGEAKSVYNNIQAAAEILAAGGPKIPENGNSGAITSEKNAVNTTLAILNGAGKLLNGVTTTTDEKIVPFYWRSAIQNFLNSPAAKITSLTVLDYLKSIIMTDATGLDFVQKGNGAIKMSVAFSTSNAVEFKGNNTTIIGYSDTFGGYGPITPSGTSGGIYNLKSTDPSPTNMLTGEIFNLASGGSLVDEYNTETSVSEELANFSGPDGTGTESDLTFVIADPVEINGAVSGFVQGATIDLLGIGTATTATLSASNMLTVKGEAAGPIALQLDPQQSYTGKGFAVSSDGNGGTDITVIIDNPPVVTAPNSATVAIGEATALGGISVADSDAVSASETLSVVLSDSAGLLSATAASGGTVSGAGTKSLTLTGSLDQINAELATVTYTYEKTSTPDGVTVAASDGRGGSDSEQIQIISDAPPIIHGPPHTQGGPPNVPFPLLGFSITDDDAISANETLDIKISAGIFSLSVSTLPGGNVTGSGTKAITLVGGLTWVNSELSTLTAVSSQSNTHDILSFSGDDGRGGNLQAPCFLSGSLILTTRGEVPVEDLTVGCEILTHSGMARRIAWIGTGKVLATRGRRDAATPVIVRKGTIADNVPHCDLRVTKGHSLYIDGALIPVEELINQRSILWDDRAQEVTIHHIELETHDVLLANGAPAESYRDDGNRWLFQNANSGWFLPPQPPCAPVLTSGPIVDAIWRRLLDRTSSQQILSLTDDSDLHLRVDGKRIDAIERSSEKYVFRLRLPARDVRLCSRAAVPQELGMARDPRLLGVAVGRIVLAMPRRQRAVEAADASLVNGYHAFEPENGTRWTNGDAAVPANLFIGMNGPAMLMLDLGAATRYLDTNAVVRAA